MADNSVGRGKNLVLILAFYIARGINRFSNALENRKGCFCFILAGKE
jgi:hypothetical protein